MKTIPAKILINHIGKFKHWKCVEIVAPCNEDAVHTPTATPDVVKSRESVPLELFASQKKILHNVANPFRFKAFSVGGRVPAAVVDGIHWYRDGGAGGEGEGAAEAPKDRIVRSNPIAVSQSYPIVRILNMPTGTGKTVMSAVGMASHLQNESVQENMKKWFSVYARTGAMCGFNGGAASGSIVFQGGLSNIERVFLPNAMLVHAPRHLVGAWRDTFVANREVLGGPDKIRIYPATAALTLSDLPVDEIRANPNVLFVFVTHESNVQRYLAVEEPFVDPERVSEAAAGEVVSAAKGVHPCRTKFRIFHYGGAIFDEADRFELPMGLTHGQIPPAMYTLLATATPNALCASTLFKVFFADRTRVDEYDRGMSTPVTNPAFIPTERHHRLTAASRQLEAHLKMTHNLDHLANLMSHNVLSLQLLDELQRDVAERVPPMHAYAFRTRMSIMQRLGLVDNDMGDHRAAQRKLEESFEIQLHGKGVAAVTASLDKAIAKQREVLAGHNCPHETPRAARSAGGFTGAVITQVAKLERMLTLRRVLGEYINEPCGICMEDPDARNGLIFTSCCGFCVCKSCHVRVVADGMSCPKCRLNHVRFASVLADEGADGEEEGAAAAPPAAKKQRGRRGASAGAGAAEQQHAIAAAVPKDKAAFEAWLSTFNPTHMSQPEAVQAVLARARSNGITHVILAGPNVDTWEIAEGVQGFEVVRPSNGRRTAMSLDRSYASFSSVAAAAGAAGAGAGGSPNKLLLLDTVKNNHKELTGIDAKLTDLIIQVTEQGVDEAEYTQLMGRAMRIGRDGHAVHCLLH